MGEWETDVGREREREGEREGRKLRTVKTTTGSSSKKYLLTLGSRPKELLPEMLAATDEMKRDKICSAIHFQKLLARGSVWRWFKSQQRTISMLCF